MSLVTNILLGNSEIAIESFGGEVVDTSLLLEELRRLYKRTGTPVEVDFRNLVNWVRLGDQLTHQIHSYPAKLLPHIAHFFLRASVYTKSNLMLDPFCGSGTVALEASLAGLKPYVADANPLALLITKVKTTPYDSRVLRDCAKIILARFKRYKTAPEISVVNDHLWYSVEKKQNLEKLLRSVLETEDEALRDFFKVCFSVVARKMSLADPAISVPVRLKTKEGFGDEVNEKIRSRLKWIKDTASVDEFAKICEANIRRIEETNQTFINRHPAIVVGTDARNLRNSTVGSDIPLKGNSIPLIITSPPYGSAQKYIRASSLSLNWLGMAAPHELSPLERKSIGREHLPGYIKPQAIDRLPAKYERFLRTVKRTNETRERITRQYLVDMRDALSEMARVTAKNGHVVLVVGNNQVCGQYLRNDEYFVHVMGQLGLTLEISLIDHIKSRGLMIKRNKTASVITRESVLVFKK